MNIVNFSKLASIKNLDVYFPLGYQFDE